MLIIRNLIYWLILCSTLIFLFPFMLLASPFRDGAGLGQNPQPLAQTHRRTQIPHHRRGKHPRPPRRHLRQTPKRLGNACPSGHFSAAGLRCQTRAVQNPLFRLGFKTGQNHRHRPQQPPRSQRTAHKTGVGAQKRRLLDYHFPRRHAPCARKTRQIQTRRRAHGENV